MGDSQISSLPGPLHETYRQLKIQQLITCPAEISDILEALRQLELPAELEEIRLLCAEKALLTVPAWCKWIQEWSTMDAQALYGLHVMSVQSGRSITLWLMFLDFVDANPAMPLDRRSVYEEAFVKTAYHLVESHLIWNRYLALEEADPAAGSEEWLQRIDNLYLRRLAIPHMSIEETFSRYSEFVSGNDNEHYESKLSKASAVFGKAKKLLHHRLDHELELKRTSGALQKFCDYLEWQAEEKVHDQSPDLATALVERALEAHPFDAQIWQLSLLLIQKVHVTGLTQYAQRATLHCPQYAFFWGIQFQCIARDHKISASAVEDIWAAFKIGAEIKHIKGDVNQYIELASNAFAALRQCSDSTSTDALNLARSASKHIAKIGHDQNFVMHRLLLEELTRHGQLAQAKAVWKSLARTHQRHAMYWLRRFEWESRHGNAKDAQTVIKSGCFETEDAPDLVFDAALVYGFTHCSSEDLVKILSVVRKARLKFADARIVVEASNPPNGSAQSVQRTEKRRASREPDDHSKSETKRLKKERQGNERSREQYSYFIRGLPLVIDDDRLDALLATLGTIMDRKSVTEQDRMLVYVEFDKAIDLVVGQQLVEKISQSARIESASGSVLFVSNFPPDFDQARLQKVFTPYGIVLDVRLPSLAFDARRRFAYVQMASAKAAVEALAMDGKVFGDLALSVLPSDPNQRKVKDVSARASNQELFVKNIAWSASAEEVGQLFRQYGDVEQVRMPQKFSDKHHDGIAFVVFTSAENAQNAIEVNGQIFKGLALLVKFVESKETTSKMKAMVNSEPLKETSSTVAVMNLSDKVSEGQLKAFAEQFGSVGSVTLRPEYGGALVSFADAKIAGRASLAMENQALGGKNVRLGTTTELLREPNPQAQKTTGLRPSSLGRRQKPRLVTASVLASVPSTAKSLGRSQDANQSSSTEKTGKTQNDFRELLK